MTSPSVGCRLGIRENSMVPVFGDAGCPEADGLVVSVLVGIAMPIVSLPGDSFWIFDKSHMGLNADDAGTK